MNYRIEEKEAKITTGNKHDRACSHPKRTSCFNTLLTFSMLKMSTLLSLVVFITLQSFHHYGILKYPRADSLMPHI